MSDAAKHPAIGSALMGRPGVHWYFIRPARHPDLAIVIFAIMFAFYGWKLEVGLTASIINTAANKGALLALVAMAQTIPVLTGGLDLSVGMIFLLTNCLAVGDRQRRPAA